MYKLEAREIYLLDRLYQLLDRFDSRTAKDIIIDAHLLSQKSNRDFFAALDEIETYGRLNETRNNVR